MKYRKSVIFVAVWWPCLIRQQYARRNHRIVAYNSITQIKKTKSRFLKKRGEISKGKIAIMLSGTARRVFTALLTRLLTKDKKQLESKSVRPRCIFEN